MTTDNIAEAAVPDHSVDARAKAVTDTRDDALEALFAGFTSGNAAKELILYGYTC